MFKKSIIGPILFVALVLLYLFLEYRSPKQHVESLSLGGVLGLEELGEVNRLRTITADKTIDVSRTKILSSKHPLRKAFEWVLREPLYAPVDSGVFMEILNAIQKLPLEEVEFESIEQKIKVMETLDKPDTFIIIDIGDNVRHLAIGMMNELTGRYFIAVDEDLYSGEGASLHALYALFANLRSRQVLGFLPEDILGISILKAGPPIVLSRSSCLKDSGDWQIVRGEEKLPADSDLIVRELGDLSRLQVNQVFDEPSGLLEATGLNDPFLLLSFDVRSPKIKSDAISEKPQEPQKKDAVSACGESENDNKKVVLQFGKGLGFQKKDKGIKASTAIYLKIAGENTIYEISQAALGDWLQHEEYFRSRTPFSYLKEGEYFAETILPDISCAILDTLDLSTPPGEALRQALLRLRVDVYLSEAEASTYPMIGGGLTLGLRSTVCGYGFDTLGKVVKDDDTVVAYVASIKGCDGQILKGVVGSESYDSLKSSISQLCTVRSSPSAKTSD